MDSGKKLVEFYEKALVRGTHEYEVAHNWGQKAYSCIVVEKVLGFAARKVYSHLFAEKLEDRERVGHLTICEADSGGKDWRPTALALFGAIWDSMSEEERSKWRRMVF